jgi:hypothetical protein
VHSVIFRYQLLHRGWLPIIPLVLTWRRASVRSEAYLDSGAFYSIFKTGLAAQLGLDLSRAKDRMFVVADGSFIPAKIVKVPIEIGGRRKIAEIAFDEVIFRESSREVELRW